MSCHALTHKILELRYSYLPFDINKFNIGHTGLKYQSRKTFTSPPRFAVEKKDKNFETTFALPSEPLSLRKNLIIWKQDFLKIASSRMFCCNFSSQQEFKSLDELGLKFLITYSHSQK